jgi:hypothetical protein
MEFPKAVATVHVKTFSGENGGGFNRASIASVSNTILPEGAYVAIPKEEYDAFYRQNVPEQVTETQTRDPKRMVCRIFEGDSIGNPVTEILAITLFYDRHNVRTGWFQASHETRTEYRNLALGLAEFEQ